jgi:uncharacterized protein YdeI (YjbR/CyaY-like superfamily)
VLKKLPKELCVANRNEWREWLIEYHDSAGYVWLVYYKQHTRKPSVSYEDSVEEAICFGWIDGVIKRIDDERCARKFMHRKSKSRWSESNKKRAEKMMRLGRMTQAGMSKIREAKESGEWFKQPAKRETLVIPAFMQDALAKNKRAFACFNGLADSYKRQYVAWVSNAKRDETRNKRLAEAITLLEQNMKLGLK